MQVNLISTRKMEINNISFLDDENLLLRNIDDVVEMGPFSMQAKAEKKVGNKVKRVLTCYISTVVCHLDCRSDFCK